MGGHGPGVDAGPVGQADDGEEVSLKLLSSSPAYEDAAVEAMRRVLENMARAGALTEAEAQAAAEGPLMLVPPG